MTALNPTAVGQMHAVPAKYSPDIPVFISQNVLYVKYDAYTRLLSEWMEDMQHFGDVSERYSEELQNHINDVQDFSQRASRQWTKRNAYDSKEKLAAAIVIVSLMALVIILAISLTVALIVLL